MYGVNFDSTKTGGESLVGGSVRFLNNSIPLKKVVSRDYEFRFCMFLGDETPESLQINVFDSNLEGSFSQFFEVAEGNGHNVLFCTDGKMAHIILLGLEGHLDAEDFQLYCEDETLPNAAKGLRDTRGDVDGTGRRVGLRKIKRMLTNPIC